MNTPKFILVAFAIMAVQPVRSETVQLAPGVFAAGVSSLEFEFFAAPTLSGRQHMPNWCWAACVQMVLSYHGLRVSQESVVERIYGRRIDSPGQPQQILTALSGWAHDGGGRISSIHASAQLTGNSELVRDLAHKWPLIVALKQPGPLSHAYVLTGVTYVTNPYTQEPVLRTAILRDPWPGNPSRIELSWPEFQNRAFFIARVFVQRH